MKLPDVNIWLALTLSGHSFHERVRDWLDAQSATESIFFCRATQQSLMRLLTTRAVLLPYGIAPLTNEKAWAVGEAFLADERVGFAAEPTGVNQRWRSWAATSNTSPKLWMDAWLAAFAYQSGFQLVTLDKAFTQFQELDAMVIGH